MNTDRRQFSFAAASGLLGLGAGSRLLAQNSPANTGAPKFFKDPTFQIIFVTSLGRAYQDGIPDYPYAINTYDSLLNRFPNTTRYEETLFNLYYCYTKLGDQENAQRILQLLSGKYPNGAFTLKAINTFVERVGITMNQTTVDVQLLESVAGPSEQIPYAMGGESATTRGIGLQFEKDSRTVLSEDPAGTR